MGMFSVTGYPEMTRKDRNGNMGGYVEGVGYLLDGTHVDGIFEGGDLEMESGMSGKMGRLKK